MQNEIDSGLISHLTNQGISEPLPFVMSADRMSTSTLAIRLYNSYEERKKENSNEKSSTYPKI